MKYDVPDEFHVGKPALPKVVKESKLEDFVGYQSWHLFQIIGISKQEVTEWLSGENGRGWLAPGAEQLLHE